MTESESESESEWVGVRYSPELRSAYIERFEPGPPVLTLYGSGLYLDETLLERSRQTYRRATVAQVCRHLLTHGPRFFEAPEPLWTRKMPQTLALLVAAHAGAAVRGRTVVTSTYCIENEHAERIGRLPDRLPPAVRRAALRLPLLVFTVLVRRWVFGTEASRRTYRGVLGEGWWRRRMPSRSRLVWPLPEACRCGLPAHEPSRVLFVGALSRRKGFDTLLRTWPRIAAAEPRARLVVMGTGELEPELRTWLRGRDDVEWLPDASRAEVHAQLRRADVVTLLSRPERYWREQIGLPLLEALAHGCTVVTTSDTGLADWLAGHGHPVLPGGATDDEVAAEMVAAMGSAGTRPAELPAVNGRAAAAGFMFEDRDAGSWRPEHEYGHRHGHGGVVGEAP